MTATVSNVLAGKPLVGGGIFTAALGTTRPTDAAAALNVSYSNLGYVHEDGVTETTERAMEKIKAWGGDIVKVSQTEHGVSYQFTLIETLNADVLKAVHGAGNVTTTAATAAKGTLHKVKLNGTELPKQQYVIEVKDGDARIRIDIGIGQITEVGDVTYSDSEVIGYPVTIECFPDSNGDKAVKYIDDGVKTGS